MMDKEIKRELANKLEASKSALVFMFNEDGMVQSYLHGSGFELMATIASEMEKESPAKSIILGAVEMFKNKHGKQG